MRSWRGGYAGDVTTRSDLANVGLDSTEVQRLRAIEQAALELVRHGPNTGHVYATFMEYYQRLADVVTSGA